MTDTQTNAFTPIPSVERMAGTSVAVAATAPKAATAVAIQVAAEGEPAVGISRERLAAAGFDATVGSTLALAGDDGAAVDEDRAAAALAGRRAAILGRGDVQLLA